MRLSDILTVDRVTTDFFARDKVSALRGIARLFNDTEPTLGEDAILAVLEAREKLASTGVGSGVAIPHGRLGALDSMRAVLAISRPGVSFDSLDGGPVHIFFAVIGPEKHSGDHLKALARISRLLRDDTVRARLLSASDAMGAFAIVAEEDERH